MTLRVYLIDDEALAIRRLIRLLRSRGDTEIIGSTTDPATAVEFLKAEAIDVVFLDIQMPGMNGFELLGKLPAQPLVIFTTAYDQHALKAFEVNSIDYLLKPIAPDKLDRALRKVASLRDTGQTLELRLQLKSLAAQIASRSAPAEISLDRVPSRLGDRVVFIELGEITHFFSEDKVTYAATELKNYIVDYSLTELERKLSRRGFVRIHRASLINLSFVDELHRWFGGRMLVRMKDKRRTELSVARDQVQTLKRRLEL
jgi:two-component system, LytTR family, response regulator